MLQIWVDAGDVTDGTPVAWWRAKHRSDPGAHGPYSYTAPAAMTKKAGMSVIYLSRILPSVTAQDEVSVLVVENQAIPNSSL